jgi:hypothetical protein
MRQRCAQGLRTIITTSPVSRNGAHRDCLIVSLFASPRLCSPIADRQCPFVLRAKRLVTRPRMRSEGNGP